MQQATGTSRATVTRVLRSGAVASGITFILSLTVVPFVLSQASLGTYGAWATIGGLLAVARLTEAGIPTEVARRVAELEGAGQREAAKRVVQQAITVMLTIGAVVLVLGAVTAAFAIPFIFPASSGSGLTTLRVVWLATVALLVVTFVLGTWFATLGGLQRQDFGAYSGVAGGIAGAVVTVATVSAGLGIWSLFLGSLAQSIVGWVGPIRGMRLVRPELALRPEPVSRAEARSLIGASTFLVVATTANLADRQIDKFVLSAARGPEAAGVFQLAVNLAQQPVLLAGLPAALLLAGTAELSSTNPAKLARLRSLTDRATHSIGFFIIGGIAVFAHDFVRLWLGRDYVDVALVAQILCVAAVPTIVVTPWYYFVIGRGWHKIVVVSALVSLVLNVIATIALTPTFGAPGAAWGSALGAAGSFVVIFVAMRQRGEGVSMRSTVLPTLIVGAATALGMLLMPDLDNWVMFVAAAATWAAVVVAGLILTRSLPVVVSRRAPYLSLSDR